MIMAPEALATLLTLVRLLTYNKLFWVFPAALYCTINKTSFKLCEEDKIAPTLYCTRVYFLMFGQVIMAYEGFPTFVALVALVIVVDSEVKPVRALQKTSL